MGSAKNSSRVSDCINKAVVTTIGSGEMHVGGITGNIEGSINKCVNTGAVTCTADSSSGRLGGISGSASGGTLAECYNRGIIGTAAVQPKSAGGILGYSSASTVSNCYNTGALYGQSMYGITSSGMTNCYYDSQTTGAVTAVAGATAKSTAEMKSYNMPLLLNGTASPTTPWTVDAEKTNDGYPVFGTYIPAADWQAIGQYHYEQNLKPAGTGASGSPFQIDSAEDLAWFMYAVNNANSTYKNAFAVLTANIDLTGADYGGTAEAPLQWLPIGKASSTSFQGSFNGNNKTISHLSIREYSAAGCGLFGYLASGGTITGVKMDASCTISSTSDSVGGVVGRTNGSVAVSNCTSAATVSGKQYVGGVVGDSASMGLTLSGCHNTGSVSGSSNYVGGIIGDAYGIVSITGCSNSGAITGGIHTGGVMGRRYMLSGNAGTITDSGLTNTGTVTGQGYSAGGIAGALALGSGANISYTLKDCTNSGTVTAASYQAGGIVGIFSTDAQTAASSSAVLENNHNTADVGGSYSIGGIIGGYSSAVSGITFTITNCTNTGAVASNATSNYGAAGIAGGISNVGPVNIERCWNRGAISNAADNAATSSCGIVSCQPSMSAGTGLLTINNCYNTGSLTNGAWLGQICGYVDNASVTNCYGAGVVTASRGALGIAGRKAGATVTNCYYDREVTNTTSDADGSVGVTTEALKGWGGAFALNGKSLSGMWTLNASNTTNGGYPVFGSSLRAAGDWGEVGQAIYGGFTTVGTVPAQSGGAYQIGAPEELAWLAYAVNTGEAAYGTANVKLTGDLDLTGGAYTGNSGTALKWLPIGSYDDGSAQNVPTIFYTGDFDGGGHTIRNINTNGVARRGGLFTYVSAGSSLKDVIIADSTIGNGALNATAGLVGVICGEGTVEVSGITLLDTVRVSGSYYVGGIVGVVGISASANISQCANYAAVSGNGEASGILGIVSGNGTVNISNCLNRGTIAVKTDTGRSAGIFANFGTAPPKYVYISNCYNTGAITGNITAQTSAPGTNGRITLTNCYYDATLAPDAVAYPGVTGMTTERMKAYNMPMMLNASTTATAPWATDEAGINDGYPVFGTYDPQGVENWSDVGEALYGMGRKPGGAGTGAAPYQIGSAEELAWFMYAVNNDNAANGRACADLTADVDLTGAAYGGTAEAPLQWTPIGENGNTKFQGAFSGNDKMISHLSIRDYSGQYAGMFGYLYTGGSVTGVKLDATCSISCTNTYVGGVVGYSSANGTTDATVISNCSSAATMTGSSSTGGVVGAAGSGVKVSGCQNTGTVTAAGDSVGGVIGDSTGASSITDCSNGGAVTGRQYVGGVAGKRAFYAGHTNVDAGLHNSGAVTASSQYVGGILGYVQNNENSTYTYTLTDSENTGEVSGQSHVGGVVGAYTNTAVGVSATLSNCTNTGAVGSTGTSYSVGAAGIAGFASTKGQMTIERCWNQGAISGAANSSGAAVGILSSQTNSSARITIDNCYNTGTLTNGKYLAQICGFVFNVEVKNSYGAGVVTSSGGALGIVGRKDGATVTNCYYDRDVTNTTSDADGSTGLTTAEMQAWAAAYRLNGSKLTGGVWAMDTTGTNGNYPVFGTLQAPPDYERTVSLAAEEAREPQWAPSNVWDNGADYPVVVAGGALTGASAAKGGTSYTLSTAAEIQSGYNAYGTASANAHVGFVVVGRDAAGDEVAWDPGTGACPDMDTITAVRLYNAAAYNELDDKGYTLTLTTAAGSKITLEATVEGVTGKTLSVSVPLSMAVTVEPPETESYSEDYRVENHSAFPIDVSLTGVRAVSSADSEALNADIPFMEPNAVIDPMKEILEAGVKFSLVNTEGSGAIAAVRYSPTKFTARDLTKLGFDGAAPFRIKLEHGKIHTGGEAYFGYDLTLAFRISTEDAAVESAAPPAG